MRGAHYEAKSLVRLALPLLERPTSFRQMVRRVFHRRRFFFGGGVLFRSKRKKTGYVFAAFFFFCEGLFCLIILLSPFSKSSVFFYLCIRRILHFLVFQERFDIENLPCGPKYFSSSWWKFLPNVLPFPFACGRSRPIKKKRRISYRLHA